MNSSTFFRYACLFGLALALPACGGCGDDGEPGAACDLNDSTSCNEGLVCAPSADGDVCQIPIGSSCNVDDEDFCLGDSVCEGNGEDAICLVPRGGECDPDAEIEECTDGLVCAPTADGNACFEEVVLRGSVFDSADESAIEGAHVIALDELGAASTDVAVTDATGDYALSLPVERDNDGKPTAQDFTLRASAQDYQTFPSGLRTALPIDASQAVDEDGTWVIDIAPTDIALIALPEGERGRPKIVGEIDADTREDGVLVVAAGAGSYASAVSDKSGNFTIFNAPSGSLEVRGYLAGLQLEPETVELADDDVENVVLAESGAGLATVTGDINIVNAPGGSVSSVVLVVEETFNETFTRGEVPAGLRAPESGPPNVDGGWSIAGVPAGSYVILAAFENDDLVRDPDFSQGGTAIVRITVPEGAGDVPAGESFKVTEALDVLAPGANAPEGVASAPTLRWADDSGEKRYSVVVFDAYGNKVWERTDVPEVNGGDDVSVPYGGPLEDGMYYQFRATSYSNNDAPISTTEDLRGVFFKE